ncbi:MAG TPA: heme ABC exporter ATP-binding protein CcmA [Allosphingosinicella sp.]|nr:heme ABC exporter ATP-binding protein CcmA [Allosphingosinicella sp.]
MNAAETLLRLDRVACVRGGRLLFEGLDLALGPGEAAIVTGPNGAGKSSLLRLAGGLLSPAAGVVARGDSVALADEGPALDAKLSLGRALGFWAKMDGRDAAAGIAAMGLAPLADVPVRMLSTGQRKRAMLARVISSGAALWLLDEPGNGLDSEGLDRLGAAMAAHRAEGGAILAASHQPLDLAGAKQVALG